MKTKKWPVWSDNVYWELESAWCDDDVEDIAEVLTCVLVELAESKRLDMPFEELPAIIKRITKRLSARGRSRARAKEKREQREQALRTAS